MEQIPPQMSMLSVHEALCTTCQGRVRWTERITRQVSPQLNVRFVPLVALRLQQSRPLRHQHKRSGTT